MKSRDSGFFLFLRHFLKYGGERSRTGALLRRYYGFSPKIKGIEANCPFLFNQIYGVFKRVNVRVNVHICRDVKMRVPENFLDVFRSGASS